jgi:hypothetical protein
MLVVKDICAKWSHFSEQDVAALNGKAELATQLAAKYGLPQARAQRKVDALLKRRQFGAAPRSPGHSPEAASSLGFISVHDESLSFEGDEAWMWGQASADPTREPPSGGSLFLCRGDSMRPSRAKRRLSLIRKAIRGGRRGQRAAA